MRDGGEETEEREREREDNTHELIRERERG